MYTSILTGVDGREGGRDALALAVVLQRAFGGEIVALHAYPREVYPVRAYDARFAREIRENAKTTLRDEIHVTGVKARGIVVADGSPARVLHSVAERDGYDVIVVGSAHYGPVGRVLAGDVATATLHGAPCAVAVAPRGFAGHEAPARTIGVAYDGSPESRAALTLAGELATASDARVHIIAVVSSVLSGAPFEDYAGDRLEHDRARRDAAQGLVDAAVAELGERATGEVLIGRADEQLVQATHDLDIVVTGSRGYGPLRRLLLGSTSTALVREAACPVIVLPRGAEEHAGADSEQSAAALSR